MASYTKELHERFRQYRNKSFFHPHECRDLQDIFLASEGFLNGTWRCPECVTKWVERLAIKFDAMEAQIKSELQQELEKAAITVSKPEEKKDEKKNKKKGE